MWPMEHLCFLTTLERCTRALGPAPTPRGCRGWVVVAVRRCDGGAVRLDAARPPRPTPTVRRFGRRRSPCGIARCWTANVTPRELFGRGLWIYVDLTQKVGLHSLCSALCHAYGVGGYAVKPLACAARGQHGAFTSPVAGRSRAHAQIISATATPWARRAEAHERRT